MILSGSKSFTEVIERVCELDIRIEQAYQDFEEIEGRDQDTMDHFVKSMERQFGKNWAFRKDAKSAAKAVYKKSKDSRDGD